MNLDTILVNGHEVSFAIDKGENGNQRLSALSDRIIKIFSAEFNQSGKLIHSIAKGLKGTRFETKAILGGIATKETGPMRFGNDNVGIFERYETKSELAGRRVANVSKFESGLEVKDEIVSLGDNNQSYTKTVNGVVAFSMVQTSEGIVLTRYDRNGNKLKDYSYDKNGKPVGGESVNFPAVPGYETLDQIDMTNPYIFEDLMLNDFVQDIGIPQDMRNTVRNVENTRYQESPMVKEVKSRMEEISKALRDKNRANFDI